MKNLRFGILCGFVGSLVFWIVSILSFKAGVKETGIVYLIFAVIVMAVIVTSASLFIKEEK